jgi:predicted metal-dependent HD superfamily phosphohydrolase
MERLRIGANLDAFDRLCAAYGERHRHYHTSEHIEHCLDELDKARHLASEPDEVELALWFHDAVYVTRASDNERKSAEWAAEFLAANGVDQHRIERVRGLIMATTHAASADGPDAELLVDIDLSILGADREIYASFERDVRKEYRWVPGPLFRRTRAKILESFLTRSSVYSTAYFRERLESAARENLARAIDDLTS